jgi:tetratricopeptide (TPR) repeat protein
MNCPKCGANIENFSDTCGLCGISIDKAAVFNEFMRRGDEYFSALDFGTAVVYYNKALEADLPRGPEIYIKLGNAMDRKNDRLTAGMYLKALSFDFYNERVHTLLMAFYEKHGRLNDLKAWYEKNRGSADDAFLDGKIATISNILSYREKAATIMTAQADEMAHSRRKDKVKMMIDGFKEYMVMNVVFGIAVIIIAAGMAGAIFFKANTAMVLITGGVLFIVSVIIAFYIGIKRIRKKRATAIKPEDIINDIKKSAGII